LIDVVEPARVVDHITPIKKGGARLDPANFQSLCNPCHGKKTAQDVVEG
jgi:5-methylcytosine-specific restriction protein A